MAGLLLWGPFVRFMVKVSVEEAGDFHFLTLLLYWISFDIFLLIL